MILIHAEAPVQEREARYRAVVSSGVAKSVAFMAAQRISFSARARTDMGTWLVAKMDAALLAEVSKVHKNVSYP